jgi:hypothetical protein
MNSHFKFTMPIVKTRTSLVKDENGKEKEERFVVGIASNTEIDLHGDRMSPDAIKTMADSLNAHIINLNNGHDTGWSSELGVITRLEITDNYELLVEARLGEYSTANDLWIALTSKNKKLGLSIGGYVKTFEMEQSEDGWIRVFKDVELDHIAVTQSPANPKTWLGAIAKSVTFNTTQELEKAVIKELEKDEFVDKIINLIKGESMKKDSLEAVKSAEPENEEEILVPEETIEDIPPVEEIETITAEEMEEEEIEEEELEEELEEEIEEIDEDEEINEDVEELEDEDETIEEEEEEEVEETEKNIATMAILSTVEKLAVAIEEQKLELVARDTIIKSLQEKIDNISKESVGRKVAISKFAEEEKDENDGEIRIDGKTEEEAIKEVEKQYANSSNLFAMKQRIRQKYQR